MITTISYKDFLKDKELSQTRLWQQFYELHQHKIEIKKQLVAEKKLALILNATFKLSHEKGFALMSLRDLSRETKMSLGGIYSYIGSKTQLALMIHQFLPFMFKRYLQLDELTNDTTLTNREKLSHLIQGHIFLTEFLRPWFFFAYMEAKYTSKEIKKIALENESKTQDIVFELVNKVQSELKIENTFLATMTIKSLLQNWYLKRPLFKKQKVTPEDYAGHIELLLDKGF